MITMPSKDGFFSVLNPPVVSGDKMSSEYNVDLTGYLPLEQQIQQMMYAGHKLDISRTFDRYEIEGVDLMTVDTSQLLPDRTRFGNYDLADYTRDQLYIRQKAQAVRKAQEEAKAKQGVAEPNPVDVVPPAAADVTAE